MAVFNLHSHKCEEGNFAPSQCRVWDPDTAEVKMVLSGGHTRGVNCLALSSDSKTLFSGGGDGIIM